MAAGGSGGSQPLRSRTGGDPHQTKGPNGNGSAKVVAGTVALPQDKDPWRREERARRLEKALKDRDYWARRAAETQKQWDGIQNGTVDLGPFQDSASVYNKLEIEKGALQSVDQEIANLYNPNYDILSTGEQAVGVAKGAWDGTVGLVKGVADTAVGLGKMAYDGSPAGTLYGALEKYGGVDVPDWLPNASRNEERVQAGVEGVKAVWNDPSLLWRDISDLWNTGHQGEAIGRVIPNVASIFLGDKGISKIGQALRMAGIAGKAGDAAKILGELGTVARQTGKWGEAVQAARQGGKLDDFLKTLSPDELKAARQHLTPEEAARLGKTDGEAIKGDKPEGTKEGDPADPAKKGEPVVLARGEYVESWEDFRVEGTIPIVAKRYYGHKFGLSGPLGRNRISLFDTVVLVTPANTLELVDAEGRRIPFERPFGHLAARNRKYRHLSLTAPWLKRLVLADRRLRLHYAQYKDKIYRLEAIEDLNGNRIALQRDAAGLLLEARHSDGLVLRFENDDVGLRRAVTLVAADGAEKRLVDYEYDADGNLLRADCSTAFSIAYAYDGHGRLEQWRDSTGRSATRFVYDEWDRVVRTETTGPWHDDRFDYDPEQRTAAYRPGNGAAVERFRFDADENLLAEEDALGRVRRYEYEDGYRTAAVDPAGNRTEYRYDAQGNLAQVTDAEERSALYRWGPNGELDIVVDGAGNAWRFRHDAAGNVVEATDPAGAVTRFSWTAAGRVARIRFPDGAEERRLYDEAHRLAAVIDPKGGRTVFTRDGFGRVVRVTDPLGSETRLGYDDTPGKPFDAPTRVTRPDGVEIRRSFDGEGQVAEVVDGEGRRTRYRYGPFDQLVEIVDPKGGALRLSYDVQGRLERVENANGRVYAYERDLAGRVVAETDFDGRRLGYAYDDADRLVERRNPDGSRIAYRWDKAGLLLEQQAFAPGADTPEEVTRTAYDGRGLLVRAENGTATVELRRDALGRVVAETVNGRRIESVYDARGNRVERRIGAAVSRPGEAEVSITRYVHDPLGLLAEIAMAGGVPLRIDRDSLGREVSRASPGGFRLEQRWDPAGQILWQGAGRRNGGAEATRGAGPGWLERRWAWDRAFEPVGIEESLWGGTRYRYDANGQVEQARFGEGGTRLWDDADAPSRDTEERFAYDPARDVVSSSASGLQAGWLRTPGGKAVEAQGPRGERIRLAYDASGRVVERVVERRGFRPQRWRYGWDAQDRLRECRTPGGETWRYGYDPFGRRAWKRREAAANDMPRHPLAPGPELGRAYQWDGDTVAAEAPIGPDGAAAWDRAVEWHVEPGTFRPLARVEDGRVHWVVCDHLGTPRELLDESGGLAWAANHHVWGELRTLWRRAANDGRPAVALAAGAEDEASHPARDAGFCPIRFPGQWADPETGLYYNRYRHYDPLAGQYASPDPIGLLGGARPQGYVRNPNAWFDPLGLQQYFSGHGSLGNGMPGDLYSELFTIPEGSSLTTYTKPGGTISDRLGQLIETGGNTNSILYKRTYNPGDLAPVVKLYPPDGLNIMGNPITVTSPTDVRDLMKQYPGECHWAACMYHPDSPNADFMNDTRGKKSK